MLEWLVLAWMAQESLSITPVLDPPKRESSLWVPASVPHKNQGALEPLWQNDESLSVLAQDLVSGKTLYQKDSNIARPIASLTKLMTFLVIWETYDLDEIVTVTPEAALTYGAQIDLFISERMTVGTLLEAILIPSANDAAKALAIHHSGSEDLFAEIMTEKAQKMGLKSAQFYNATGLDIPHKETGESYGNLMSATDLKVLTQRLLAIDWFRKTVAKGEFFGTSADGTFAHNKATTNQLYGSFVGSKGIKTGYTELAGQCLIHLSERADGVEILTIVQGSKDRFQETKNLITWLWDNFVWR